MIGGEKRVKHRKIACGGCRKVSVDVEETRTNVEKSARLGVRIAQRNPVKTPNGGRGA